MSYMSLSESWMVLGEDPEEIFNEIRESGDRDDRVKKAEFLLKRAEKVSKVLMAVHHPDKNPGDDRSLSKFKRIQRAIESIRFNTEQLKEINSITHIPSNPNIIIFD